MQQDKLDDALDDEIDNAAIEAGNRAQHAPQDEGKGHADQPDRHRDADAIHHARKHIAARIIRTQ